MATCQEPEAAPPKSIDLRIIFSFSENLTTLTATAATLYKEVLDFITARSIKCKVLSTIDWSKNSTELDRSGNSTEGIQTMSLCCSLACALFKFALTMMVTTKALRLTRETLALGSTLRIKS